MSDRSSNELIELTADIVSAHVANNNIAVGEVPTLIQNVFGALSALGVPAEAPAPPRPKGAIGVRASIKPDYLISMLDGKPYKMLKRHLKKRGYTPESYREIFNLSKDYPMVAENYAQARRSLAKSIGLGRGGRSPKPADPVASPRTRKPKIGLPKI